MASESWLPPIVKNSIAIRISREMALDYGMVEPTPEEAAERAASLAAYRERERAAWDVYDAARDALAALPDPLTRALLDLHHSETVDFPKCEGCDMDGYECETPDWPCRTVRAIAEHHGIAMPDVTLWRRPEATR